MFPALWWAAVRYGVDPVGVVAQSWKETGGGHFTGRVKPLFYNTCGLKIRHLDLFPGVTDGDNPLAHQMFPNWTIGALAHVQHLRAYAGWAVPEDELFDPRYVYVIGRDPVDTFEELSGKWAPSPTYGQEIVRLAQQLAGG